MRYTLLSGKSPFVVRNTRPSTMRYSDVLNTPPDTPKFSRVSAVFQKVRLRRPSPPLTYLVVPLRANTLTPRSKTIMTVRYARVGVQAGATPMIFRRLTEPAALQTTSSAGVPTTLGRHDPNPTLILIRLYSYLQTIHRRHAVQTRIYPPLPSCLLQHVPPERI